MVRLVECLLGLRGRSKPPVRKGKGSTWARKIIEPRKRGDYPGGSRKRTTDPMRGVEEKAVEGKLDVREGKDLGGSGK